jgi:hypothetical protein
MQKDDTIKAILLDIKNEIEEETDEEFSIEELFSIVNSQFVAGGLAINKRLSIFYSYIGTFIFKNKKAYSKSVKDVYNLKGTIPDEEYNTIVKKKRIANSKVMKGSNLKLITELKDLPEDVSELMIMQSYNEIYQELLNNETVDNE